MVAAQIVAGTASAHHIAAMLQRHDENVIGLPGEIMSTATRTTYFAIAIAALACAITATQAQTSTPPATPSAASPNAVAPPPAGAASKQAAKPRECTRLPLSDIQVGKDKTIEVARLRLDEYVAKVGKQRGWKSWDKSLETVACEDYLFVPLLGQEYKCLVTATFCKKS
jgi:hypothetical protein